MTVISLGKIKEENYAVALLVQGSDIAQVTESSVFFAEYGNEIRLGDVLRDTFIHDFPCKVVDVFISDQTKTVFIALNEATDEELDEYDIRNNIR